MLRTNHLQNFIFLFTIRKGALVFKFSKEYSTAEHSGIYFNGECWYNLRNLFNVQRAMKPDM